MNFKKILLGSAICASSFGLVACGGDSSSSGPDDNPTPQSSSSGPIIPIPEASAINPIVFSGFSTLVTTGGVTANSSTVSVSGLVKLDLDNIAIDERFSPDATTFIDSIQVYIVDEKSAQQNAGISFAGSFPTDKISLSGQSFDTSILNGCGSFHLLVFVYSSTKDVDPSVAPANYISVFGDEPQEITDGTFVRDASQCQAPVQSSSSVPEGPKACTPVAPVPVTLSNKVVGDQDGLNFADGSAVNPDIKLSFADGEPVLTPSAGVSFVEETKQTSFKLPDATQQICLEDFSGSRAYTDETVFNGLWLIVTAADGKTYPMMVGSVMNESKTKGTLEITYYK